MLSAKVTMRTKLPVLDFTRTLEEVAQKLIIPDMRLGINRGIGVDNAPFPPLELSTVARKLGARRAARRSGGLRAAGLASAGRQTLVDTGELRESFSQETVKKNHVRVFLAGGRQQVGYFLQVTGVGKRGKKFNFFGISQRAEFQAISKMRQALGEALRAVNGR